MIHSFRYEEAFHDEEFLFETKNSKYFIHDACEGYIDIFDPCDVFYVEPSWGKGYDIFKKRGNIKNDNTFNDYISGISSFLKKDVPTVLIIGKSIFNKLKIDYSFIKKIKLNGFKENAYFFNFNKHIQEEFKDNFELIKYLAVNFNCVGDFSCGYGNTGIIFNEYGKKAICSDINKKCIGYIKNHYENI